MPVHVYAHTCAGSPGNQERAMDPVELELQTVACCLTSVLGTEF